MSYEHNFGHKKTPGTARSSFTFLAPFFKVVAIRFKSRLFKFKKKLESLQNKIYFTNLWE
ncbi:uncharacterized protein METZ01_LOCUS212585 [marine metagenome]|uniref:Uncharacterized protein n=1 Tax=marine metagenome TaxID=408172 RepID=A0A382FCF9_9ZZZZ